MYYIIKYDILPGLYNTTISSFLNESRNPSTFFPSRNKNKTLNSSQTNPTIKKTHTHTVFIKSTRKPNNFPRRVRPFSGRFVFRQTGREKTASACKVHFLRLAQVGFRNSTTRDGNPESRCPG